MFKARLAAASIAFAFALVGWPAIVAAQTQCQTPTNLVAWWPLDGTGADVARGHNGVVGGAATFVTGVAGPALNVDGISGGYLAVPESPHLSPTTAITVEAWVNPTAFAFNTILRKSGPTEHSGYSLEMGGGDVLRFWVYLEGQGWASAGGVIRFGEWTHVAGSYDGREVRFYLNGVLTDSSVAPGSMLPATGPLNIGRDPLVLGRHFQGYIDEVGIFNAALPPAEIQALYTAGAAGKCRVLETSARPLLSLPTNLAVHTRSTSGRVVVFEAKAWDVLEGQVPAVCSPTSGSIFPPGTTTVACTATNSRGLGAAATFSVTVVHGAGPSPAPVLETHSVTVSYGRATATLDAVLVGGAYGVGQKLDFTVRGVPAGFSFTDVNGVAALTNVSIAGLEPGTYSNAIVATVGASTDVPPLEALADLIVSRASPTIIVTAAGTMALDGSILEAPSFSIAGGLDGSFEYAAGGLPGVSDRPQLCVTFTPTDTTHYSIARSCRQSIFHLVSSRSHPILEAALNVGGAWQNSSVTVDPSRNVLYAGNGADGTIVVFDGTDHHPLATIRLESQGLSGWANLIAVDPVRDRLYVIDLKQPLLWTIDRTTRAVLGAAVLNDHDVWADSGSFLVNPATGLGYVSSSRSRSYSEIGFEALAVFDLAHPDHALALVRTQGCVPESVAIDPGLNLIYDSCGNVIGGDPSDLPSFNQITFNTGVTGPVAVNPRTHAVYVVARFQESVSVFDGDKRRPTYGQLMARFSPYQSIASPVNDYGSSYIYGYSGVPSIDVNPVNELVYVKLEMGGPPYGLAALDGTTLDLVSYTVFNADSVINHGGRVAVNPGTGRVYVTGGFESTTTTWVFSDRVPFSTATPSLTTPLQVATPAASITFASVASAGTTTIQQVDPTQLGLPPPSRFSLSGALAYEVSTTASVGAPIQLCFNASSIDDQPTFDSLAVLHGENGTLVDRTTSRDFVTRTICATVSSLSPFVIARAKTVNYTVKTLYSVTKAVKSGSTIPLKLQLLDTSGANVSAAALTVTAVGMTLKGSTASVPIADAGAANPGVIFRFDPELAGYILNLSTRGLAPGVYQLALRATADPRTHTIEFSVDR